MKAVALQRWARIGWMLRVNRLYGPDVRWARIPAFAGAFQGGSYPRTASVSTISRWETAELTVTDAVLHRYEELLELPCDLLTATAHTVLRYSAPATLRQPALTGPVERRDLEQVLDAAFGGEVMTGRGWSDLSGGLGAAGDAALMPSRVWRELADRLLAEMVIADGVAWMLRFEALNRLLNHPIGGRETVAACTEYANDARNQAVFEVVCALDNTDRQDSTIWITDSIRFPANDRSRYGALAAGVRKARYGHFTPGQIRSLLRGFDDLVRDSRTTAAERSLAALILRELPTMHTIEARRILERIRREAEVAQALLEHGQPERHLARLLTARAIASQQRHLPGEHEQTFAVLVDELMCDPSPDVRLFTSCLLTATPYGSLLADAIAEQLGRASTLRDARIAVPLLDALRFLGHHRHRPLLERLILAPGLSPPIAAAAARHLGHVGTDSNPAFWAQALSLHLGGDHGRHRSDSDASIVRDLIYALGRARRTDALKRLCLEPQLHQSARSAAAWWCAIPDLVYHSSTR